MPTKTAMRRTLIGMTMRRADGASARAVLSVAADRTTSLLADGFLVVTGMSAVKRRTPSVVVREPRTAPVSAEDPAAGGHRPGRHDPRVVVGRSGPQRRRCWWIGSAGRRYGG